MHRLCLLLSLIVSVGSLLVPAGQLHAHVTGVPHAHDAQGGHPHDFDHAQGSAAEHEDGESDAKPVDVKTTAQGQLNLLAWLTSASLASAVLLMVWQRKRLGFGRRRQARTASTSVSVAAPTSRAS